MREKEGAFDLQFKILTIGDSEVGKTCFIWRYAADQFSTRTMNTIGIDFKAKMIKIDNKIIKLQIWDTAGQERFRNITTSYFRGAHGIILVYDITDKHSFASVYDWLEQIKALADDNVNKILVGNKLDLDDHRVITYEEGSSLANAYNMKFFETSAKTGINVAEAVQALSMEVYGRIGSLDPHESMEPGSTGLYPLRSIRVNNPNKGKMTKGCVC